MLDDFADPFPRPFRQGNIDRLCGPYAVVNATRLAMYESVSLNHFECLGLFDVLMARLDTKGMLGNAHMFGTSIKAIRCLLQATSEWLATNHGWRLVFWRPWPKRRPAPSLGKVCGQLCRHVARPQAAVVLWLDGHVGIQDHWSVAHRIAGDRIELLDSAGMRSLPLAATAHSLGDVDSFEDEWFWVPRGTFFIEAVMV